MVFQTHNPRKSDEWTIERVALLLKLDAEAVLSRSQIAQQLHIQTGSKFTRNAVIGKLLRLGAPMRGPRPNIRLVPRDVIVRIRRQPAERKPFPKPVHILLESLRVALIDLTETNCKFITSSEDHPVEYCGHPISQRSYCAAHHQICYYPAAKSQPDVSHRNRLMNARLFRQSLLKPSCESA